MKNQCGVLWACVAVALLAACGRAAGNLPWSGSQSTPSRSVPSSPLSVIYKVLHSFGKGTDGRVPAASLVAMNGALYGTTENGGTRDAGTVFSIGPNGSEKVLHSFGSRSDGAHSAASLLDVNGTLYGTTESGGVDDGGTVFSINARGTEKVLYSFSYSFPGSGPAASLIDVNGTMYGTTFGGGAYGYGTVFTISTSGTEKVLHSFGHGSDGKYPSAALIDVHGTLYGTTEAGGALGDGTFFRISTSGSEKVLHSFGSGSHGQNPSSALIDVDNTLYGTTPSGYGTTPSGGAYGNEYPEGTVFNVSTSGTEKVLHTFDCCSDGAQPAASLSDVNGTLYGTTVNGGVSAGSQCIGAGSGSVFSIRTSGIENVLHSFSANRSDGGSPRAALIDVNGTFYGTASDGGAYGDGTVFSITPTGTARSSLRRPGPH